jgi:(p)ppGpp synthase/HD superfamily hydrolase
MLGYSDRINHALAFAAKHRGGAASGSSDMASIAQPANLAIILTRYGCDHVTVEAGILHHVLEECHPEQRPTMEHKIGNKFGPVVLAVAREAAEPKYDRFGRERPWQVYKRDHLAQLAAAEPRAVDICVADEIHRCGSVLAALRRLGVEYLRTVSRAGSDQAIWWYCSLLEVLEARTEWTRREMLGELRILSADLIRGLRDNEEDL